jgi:predicted nuclease with TOPRIM domain
VDELKKELMDSGEKLSQARKDKHDLELELIETKDKLSELFVQNSGLIEDLTKCQQEVSVNMMF